MKNPPSSNESAHVPYEALGRFLAGTIEADEKADVERHLADCAFCRQDFQDAQAWKGQLPEAAAAKPKPGGMMVILGALGAAALIGFLWWNFI